MSIKRRTRSQSLILLAVLLPAFAVAGDETENWLRLERLNQSSRQTLDRMPSQSRPAPDSSIWPREPYRQPDTQQDSALRRLQEAQRRRQIVEGQRLRTLPGEQPAMRMQSDQIRRMREIQEQRYFLWQYGNRQRW